MTTPMQDPVACADRPAGGPPGADSSTPVTTAVEFRVAQLLPPMPLSLAAAIYRSIGEACEDQGYEAFAKKEDGLGVIWARKVES